MALLIVGCAGGGGDPDLRLDAGVDMTVAGPEPDMSMSMNSMLVCNALLACVNKCPDRLCDGDCLKRASTRARQLFDDLGTCLYGGQNGGGACPDTNGGVCDRGTGSYDVKKCGACLQQAQDRGGACRNELLLCTGDCNTDEDCAGLGCGGMPCTCQDNLCR